MRIVIFLCAIVGYLPPTYGMDDCDDSKKANEIIAIEGQNLDTIPEDHLLAIMRRLPINALISLVLVNKQTQAKSNIEQLCKLIQCNNLLHQIRKKITSTKDPSANATEIIKLGDKITGLNNINLSLLADFNAMMELDFRKASLKTEKREEVTVLVRSVPRQPVFINFDRLQNAQLLIGNFYNFTPSRLDKGTWKTYIREIAKKPKLMVGGAVLVITALSVGMYYIFFYPGITTRQ